MSRQNPDVLDHLYAPTVSPPKESVNYSSVQSNVHPLHLEPQLIKPQELYHTPRVSLFRQLLNSRSPVQSPPSLVQRATRKGVKGGGRIPQLLRKDTMAPPVVKLAGVTVDRHKEQAVTVHSPQEPSILDPCDKDVVLTALRQRRYEESEGGSEGILCCYFKGSDTPLLDLIATPPLW